MMKTWNKLVPAAGAAALAAVIGGVIASIGGGSQPFASPYQRMIAALLAAAAAGICIDIFKRQSRGKLSLPERLGFGVSSFCAIAQNFVFLAYGLYRSLTACSGSVGMTIAALCGYVAVYLIDTAITYYGIVLFMDKPWGMIAPMLIACAGANLITMW